MYTHTFLSLPFPFHPIRFQSHRFSNFIVVVASFRFVFCQMFGLMMALMDGSHVSGSHLVIYLKTFQINRPQLSQSLRKRVPLAPLIQRIVQRGDFYRNKPTYYLLLIIRNYVQFLSNYENLLHVTARLYFFQVFKSPISCLQLPFGESRAN